MKSSAVEAMADDIDAHGLLQNLVAYEDDGLLPAHWLPAPMRIGAFDRAENEREDFEAYMDEDGSEQEELADEEMA